MSGCDIFKHLWLKDEAIKKDKLLSSSKLVADLQRRITNYRNDRLKKNGEN